VPALIVAQVFAILVQIALIFVDVALIRVAIRPIFGQIFLIVSNVFLVTLNVLLLRGGILAPGRGTTHEQTGKCECEHTSTDEIFCLHDRLSRRKRSEICRCC